MSIKTFKAKPQEATPLPPQRPRVQLPTRTVTVRPPTLQFGVIVESISPAIIAAVTRDLIALLGTMNAGARIQLLSPNVEDLRTYISSALPVDFITASFKDCATWKGYWVHSRPVAPEGVRCQLWSRVYNPTQKRIVLKPTPVPPSLPIFDTPRLAPPGLSPNTRIMPARPPNSSPSQVPNLYPWLG